MESVVTILHSGNPKNCDLSFAKLVNFLGRDYEFIHHTNYITDITASIESIEEDNILALSCSTLVNIHKNHVISKSFESLLKDKISFLFVYGISPGISENEALCYLSEGVIKSIYSFPNNDYEYEVNKEFKEICRQFSGLRFGPILSSVDFGLQVDELVNETDNLITINKNPFFIRTRRGSCQIFVSATNEIIDIHETTDKPISVEGIFSKIIPPMMFLRYVFKDHCWHNNTAQGCFIIDDPLLKKKYGYLDYELLLKEMEHHNFHTSIAFIPWNFKRGNKEVIDLFKERANRFSLCVHGCDHTGGEFGSVDYGELDYRIKQATRRMIFHKEITGLEFDRVMVFPQEVFSTTSLMVLKSNSYLAVVNSGIIPFNWSKPLRIDSLLQPAVMDYENFPIFQRRSPRQIADFALDLFLGKPMLIYVHHDYFREGYGKLKEFMRGINSLVDNVEWKRLEDIMQSSYLKKEEENNIARIKLYTNNMLITNASEDVKSYIITKNETCNVLIDNVMINRAKIPYQINNQLLTVCVKVKPKDIAEIVISYRDQSTNMTQSIGISKTLKVHLRRYLSEFRDNYIIRSKILHATIKRLISVFTHDYSPPSKR